MLLEPSHRLNVRIRSRFFLDPEQTCWPIGPYFWFVDLEQVFGTSVTCSTPKVSVSCCCCFIDLFSYLVSSNQTHPNIDNTTYGGVNPTASVKSIRHGGHPLML